MTSTKKHTEITLLGAHGNGIGCDAAGCGQYAAFLFRIGDGPIEALCALHASEAGVKRGISLPKHPHRVLAAQGN
jgi:hypothetical protein